VMEYCEKRMASGSHNRLFDLRHDNVLTTHRVIGRGNQRWNCVEFCCAVIK
jgi:hypothetical protein